MQTLRQFPAYYRRLKQTPKDILYPLALRNASPVGLSVPSAPLVRYVDEGVVSWKAPQHPR